MNLATWLTSLVPSLVARVLSSLGMGLVTVGGMSVISTQLLAYVQGAVGGVPADVLSLLALAGLGDALNIVIGAITARITLYTITSSARIIGTAT